MKMPNTIPVLEGNPSPGVHVVRDRVALGLGSELFVTEDVWKRNRMEMAVRGGGWGVGGRVPMALQMRYFKGQLGFQGGSRLTKQASIANQATLPGGGQDFGPVALFAVFSWCHFG